MLDKVEVEVTEYWEENGPELGLARHLAAPHVNEWPYTHLVHVQRALNPSLELAKALLLVSRVERQNLFRPDGTYACNEVLDVRWVPHAPELLEHGRRVTQRILARTAGLLGVDRDRLDQLLRRNGGRRG